MRNAIGSVGDRMLRRVLKEERAGACVPEVGRLCFCRSHRQYRFACNGVCTKRSNTC
ncbi:hypothetical protein [Embleya sp. NBC_00896]|uniref:hypothetical protein n=1 Tax=Embleya sp. NBC_00896 TaxID=2975961 RepID=UPI002F919BF9|nr:hypothetical protein OG928_41760 [Embleya sp. NBC_00896]